jgi:hypothetical protein
MGYADKIGKVFSLPLLSSENSRRNGWPSIRHAEGTNCSWGKLNSISDFLQDIAAPAG